jgi:pimeloyl-ACP methyl ester carboxylesterase/membrane protein DedA with SNARE-associated domain
VSRLRLALLLYLLLGLASRATIAWLPKDRPLSPGARALPVFAHAEGRRTSDRVTLAYHDSSPKKAGRPGDPRAAFAPPDEGGIPSNDVVLLLHGSPGSLQDFSALAERLDHDQRVLVPDLLGFGHSSRDVPDFSLVAQADALLQLLDALAIDRAHVVGFSFGGGVAIELASRAPERVASLALVSSLGVEELELLGRADLNHLVHRLQQGLVTLLDWAIPHFGTFDDGFGARGFLRSFVDSDQRPLRRALERHDGPLLIVHGRDDFLVPPSAAREHHRIVPQSRIVWIDGGHLVLWRHRETVAKALVEWLDAARTEGLPTRAEASPERLAAAALPFDRRLAGPQDGLGWAVFFALVLAASLAGEDLTCIGVGMLVATGQVGWAGALLACVFALVVGDLMLYAGGRFFGAAFLSRLRRGPDELAAVGPVLETVPPVRSSDRRGTFVARLARSRGLVVLLGRFVPGARLPTYVAAGVQRAPVLPFTGWLIVAALLWAPTIVGLSVFGGRLVEDRLGSTTSGRVLAVLLVVLVAVTARIVPRAVTHRGRRLLLSRWRRLVRWEFWPIWAIYVPLLPCFAWLALRHRSLRVATLVNPPIPGGGLAGESKAEIQDRLAASPEHRVATAVVEPGSVGARCAAVASFVSKHGLDYPIVLKPDVGERGRDVEIAADEDAVRGYFESHAFRVLAQEFIAGDEFGLFYTRLPGETTGRLISIARKTPRFVTGNARDTLERLILDDPICLPVAETLLELNRSRLLTIPDAGERVRLTQLGTHSRGCRFLVGEDLRSKALERAVDSASRSAGLDFGRYDVRAESESALREGRFAVIEFNGLTGEAAHMYDPRFGLVAGLRILAVQWRTAFAIGAAHRNRGRRPLAWRTLAGLIRSARAGAR